MERRHLELRGQANHDQQAHLVQLRWVHWLHTVELASLAVGGKLHTKEAIGRQAMAAPRHETTHAPPSVHVTDERNRQPEIFPQWHAKNFGRDEQDRRAAYESWHGGHSTPRRLAIVEPSSDDHCEHPPAPTCQSEAVEILSGFSSAQFLSTGGGIHPEEQVTDAKRDQQRVRMDLPGLYTEGDGNNGPHGMVAYEKKNTQWIESPLGVVKNMFC